MRDLSLHLMDIIQNSIAAKSKKIIITISIDLKSDKLTIELSDDGIGMDEELLKKVSDPFVTTRDTRKVGMGISLFKAACERVSGNLTLSSIKGKGTTLKANLTIGHIDRPPLGDIADTLTGIIAASPDIDLVLVMRRDSEQICFDSHEVKLRLGEVPINEYEVLKWIRDYINEGIKNIFGGGLNEVNS